MEDKNQSQQDQKNVTKSALQKPVINPFENNQSAAKDIEESAEELAKEQEFKEAQQGRD